LESSDSIRLERHVTHFIAKVDLIFPIVISQSKDGIFVAVALDVTCQISALTIAAVVSGSRTASAPALGPARRASTYAINALLIVFALVSAVFAVLGRAQRGWGELAAAPTGPHFIPAVAAISLGAESRASSIAAFLIERVADSSRAATAESLVSEWIDAQPLAGNLLTGTSADASAGVKKNLDLAIHWAWVIGVALACASLAIPGIAICALVRSAWSSVWTVAVRAVDGVKILG